MSYSVTKSDETLLDQDLVKKVMRYRLLTILLPVVFTLPVMLLMTGVALLRGNLSFAIGFTLFWMFFLVDYFAHKVLKFLYDRSFNSAVDEADVRIKEALLRKYKLTVTDKISFDVIEVGGVTEFRVTPIFHNALDLETRTFAKVLFEVTDSGTDVELRSTIAL